MKKLDWIIENVLVYFLMASAFLFCAVIFAVAIPLGWAGDLYERIRGKNATR